MYLTLLGTGCPSVDHSRFGPANLITTDKSSILIDCGSGITQRLHQIKKSSADIDALFLTHLHSDHVIDLYQLIISSWHSYRTKPWKIYGPKGTKNFVNNLLNTWKDERSLRISYEKRSSINAFNIIIYEFENYGNIRIKDLTVEYFTVDHKPVEYAYGFNVYNKNKKLTISGDTKPCENIIKYAQLADLLLHEVFIEGEIKPNKKMRSKKTLHNVKLYHTPSSILGKIANLTRCKKLVLTHFVPTKFNEKKLINLIRRDYDKNLVIGKDLLRIKI